MTLLGFLIQYKWVILFYSIILILIIANRKKFQIEAYIIAMLRTKLGLKLMDKLSSRWREFFRVIGYASVGVAFIGMCVISYFLLQNLYMLLTVPGAKSGLSLVIPGVKIPGATVFVPLWYGIISIFIVATVHEFSHGVMARVHSIKVKSSGIVFFGPIIGAFVEPDEKVLRSKNDIAQYSVFAAGPVSNVILALVVLLLLVVLIVPVQNAMTKPNGVSFIEVKEGYPAYAAGLRAGVAVTEVNGIIINDSDAFLNAMSCVKPNQTLNFLTANSTYTITATESPDNKNKGYIGIYGIATERELKNKNQKIPYEIITWIAELFNWIVMLSLGIGLANLLPLGPVDGGRMLQVASANISGKKRGDKIWKAISLICLLLLIVNIFWPFFKWIFNLFI